MADARQTATLASDTFDDDIAKLQAQIAHYNDLEAKEPSEANRKFLREKRRALESQLQKAQEQASTGAMADATGSLDPFADRSPAEQAKLDAALGVIDPNDLHQFGGPDEANRVIGDNEQIQANNLDSVWGDAESAFDPLKSAYGDVAYSEDELARMGQGRDYFGNLMKGGGRDAVSEAEYGKRVADAEQIRRAQTDAALAAEEARGGSSAGARVLAEQAASSGQIADTYRAGLDANAMAQQRRDSAGQTYYDMSKGIGDTRFNADFDVAGGMDTFGLNKAGGQDAFTSSKNVALDNVARQNEAARLDAASYNADKQTGAADTNINRDWETGDANVDTWNSAFAGNAANRAAGTGAWLSSMGQQGSQTLGQGSNAIGRFNAVTSRDAQPTDLERAWGMGTQVVGGAGDVLGNIPRAEPTTYQNPKKRGT